MYNHAQIQWLLDLEHLERTYWKGYYEAAPHHVKQSLGLDFEWINGVACFSMNRHDILAYNRVFGLGLDRQVTRETLDEIQQWYEERDVPRYFLPLAPVAATAVNGADLAWPDTQPYNSWVKLAAVIPVTVREPGHALRIVRATEKDRETIETILENAFDMPAGSAAFGTYTLGKPDWRFFLAYQEDRPVAAASLFLQGRFASLSMAGTVQQARGLGAQKALIHARMKEALREGARYIVSETGEHRPDQPGISYLNMRAMGLQEIYKRPNYIRHAQQLIQKAG